MLNALKKILILVILLVAGYVFWLIFVAEDGFSKAMVLSAAVEKDRSEAPSLNKKDYSVFLRSLQRRKIFATGITKDTSGAKKVDREKAKRAIESLKLVGIIQGTPPRAIVEDSKKKQTFYLKEGDSLLDNIKVEKVTKGSVILNYQGEKFELYL